MSNGVRTDHNNVHTDVNGNRFTTNGGGQPVGPQPVTVQIGWGQTRPGQWDGRKVV